MANASKSKIGLVTLATAAVLGTAWLGYRLTVPHAGLGWGVASLLTMPRGRIAPAPSAAKPTGDASQLANFRHDPAASAALDGSSAGATGPAARLELAALEDALKRDDVCYIANHLFRKSSKDSEVEISKDLPLSVLADLIFQNRNPFVPEGDSRDRMIATLARAFAAPNYGAMYSELSTYSSEGTDLMRAVLLGDMMYEGDGRGKFEGVNLNQSYELLEELRRRFPDNAAIPFIEAGVKYKIDGDLAGLRPLFMSAFNAPRFNFYFTETNRVTAEHSFVSSSYFQLSVPLMAGNPLIDYITVAHLIPQYFEQNNDLEFTEGALRFGRKLMEPAQIYGQYKEVTFWSAVEYAIGQTAIGAHAWRKLYPGKPFPPDLEKTYRAHYNNVQDARWTAAFEKLWASAEGQCDRADFDRLVRQEREVYQSFRSGSRAIAGQGESR